MSNRTFLKILEELNWPMIYLVDPKQFEKVEGDKLKGYCGMASPSHNVITIDKGLRGRVLANTIYHEIAHILFPYRKHWWIECASEKLAGGGGRGVYSIRHGHTVDEMPSRARLLELFRNAVERFNHEQ